MALGSVVGERDRRHVDSPGIARLREEPPSLDRIKTRPAGAAVAGQAVGHEISRGDLATPCHVGDQGLTIDRQRQALPQEQVV